MLKSVVIDHFPNLTAHNSACKAVAAERTTTYKLGRQGRALNSTYVFAVVPFFTELA